VSQGRFKVYNTGVMITDKTREIEGAAIQALAGTPVETAILRLLLEAGDPVSARVLCDAARRMTRACFGGRILLFAPLYFSNLCVNNCLYCGFRRESRFGRTVLTPEEMSEEALALLRMGHRRILIIASEDPSPQGLQRQITAARRARAAVADGARALHLSAELAPADEKHFSELAEAGVDSYVLFQETYDRGLYARVHPEGPKHDYDFRLEAPERARRSGIPHVGLGVLLGLRDPFDEVIDLIDHARRIETSTGVPPRTVSLPRIEPAEGSDLSRHPYRPVTDAELLRMIAVVRIALPRTGIVLSSRETPLFREAALEWGVTEMSAGSRTDPGGYTSAPGECRLAQFEVQDHRGFDTMVAVLRAHGLEPCTGG
jgi:2-iminoacetate synthase